MADRHPIIALWCHPRSMSTATERIMRERGDMTCFHEPFMYFHYVHRQVREMPHFDVEPDRPASLEDIFSMLRDATETGPVFFKDMSYYVVEHLNELARELPDLVNVFLVRDPRRSILSYHKLDPDFTRDEVGLEAQWKHAEWLQEHTGNWPLVLRAEAIQNDPESEIGKLWEQGGLPFVSEAFEWGNKVPDDWTQVSGWHGTASESAGIKPLDNDDDLAQRFEQKVNEAPRLQEMLDHHLPFYQRLVGIAATNE